jgi:hypothetical protein
MDRPITESEAAIVHWLLSHTAIGDVSGYGETSISGLRVVGGCDCGCRSIDFVSDTRGGELIADALAVYPDGQEAGLILWGRAGAITALEVYDHHPDSSHRMPEVANLRTFEDRGRELIERSDE